MSLLRFICAAEALRLRAERHRSLGGALGLAADLWPHQVVNIAAVLEDIGVRHVLADEVGLGKTIQALAVIRAVKLSQPGAQIVVFCPDELVRQWTIEALARAAMALDDGAPDADPAQPLLLWPKRLRDSPELAGRLDGADLIIVDELPRLTVALQRRLCAAMSAAPSALVLTANPPLRDDVEGARLLGVVEPWRSGGGSPWGAALAREEAAAAELRAVDAGPSAWAAAAARLGASRRVLRAARHDEVVSWIDREVRLVWVEPTDAERERQRLLWRWMKVAVDTTRTFDLVRLAQRVRSIPSAQQRAAYLIRNGHEREGLLEAIGAGLLPSGGDSRLEALFDELARIWVTEPDARIVIGANDNLTVDYLAKLLPQVFDEAGPDGGPLAVARVRNQTEGPGALIDPDDVVAAEVNAFTRGDAKVMLLTDEGVAGINLQVARHVVVYACSWSLAELDQLIGRVDRVRAGAGEEPRPVRVTVLAQRGLVDERIVEVVLVTGALDRPLDAAQVDLVAVSELVAQAGLSDESVGWRAAARSAEQLRGGRALPADELPLREHQRDRGAAASATIERCLGAPAAWPAPRGPTAGAEARERALWAWLKHLQDVSVYNLGRTDGGARRLRYQLANPDGRPAAAQHEHPLSVLPRGTSSARFWLRRDPRAATGDLAVRTEAVELLDHGGALHDALMSAFIPQGRATLAGAEVYARRDGRLWGLRGWAAHVVVTAAFSPTLCAADLAGSPVAAAGLAADQRWLDGQVGGAVLADGWLTNGDGSARTMTGDELSAALHPDPEADVDRWRSAALLRDLGAPGRSGAAAAERALQVRWAKWWAARLPDLQRAVEERVAVLEGERDDLAERIKQARESGSLASRALNELERRREELGAQVAARAARLRAAVDAAPPVSRSVSLTMLVG